MLLKSSRPRRLASAMAAKPVASNAQVGGSGTSLGSGPGVTLLDRNPSP
jgi:hypothetical protein